MGSTATTHFSTLRSEWAMEGASFCENPPLSPRHIQTEMPGVLGYTQAWGIRGTSLPPLFWNCAVGTLRFIMRPLPNAPLQDQKIRAPCSAT
jgi:hypothetical protein